MISINPILLSLFGVAYGQLFTQRLTEIIQPSSTPILQQTIEITANYSGTAALLNVTTAFSNGECMNPVVAIEREAIDYNEGDEFLNIYFGAYEDENLLIQCGAGGDEVDNNCGAYVHCGTFALPAGTYSLLEFFVFQPDTVELLCGDGVDFFGDQFDEEGPVRSVRVRLTISCQVEIQCEESAEDEGDDDDDDDSESMDSSEDAAVRSIENELVNDYQTQDTDYQKREIVPVHIECKSYYNILLMIVLCICLCWITQCALFCHYK